MRIVPPERIHLARLPTPLVPLERISAELGGPRIWLKCDDLTGSLMSGNKVRKLEYVIAEAQAHGCDTLITCGGLQSNHCRATAVAGAQLGMNVHLILRGKGAEGAPDGNLFLDYLCGARVSVCPPAVYVKELDNLFAEWRSHYQEQGNQAWCIPTGASDGTGLWGYIEASRELADDFSRHNIEPDLIVCATGSGGTQAGLTLGAYLNKLRAKVVGMAVCDSSDYFANKTKADAREWYEKYITADEDFDTFWSRLEVKTLDNYIGPGYSIAYPQVLETISHVAKTEGVVLDPVYTGKAFYGLTREIREGRWSHMNDIVFVHTGGVYGNYVYRDQYASGGFLAN